MVDFNDYAPVQKAPADLPSPAVAQIAPERPRRGKRALTGAKPAAPVLPAPEPVPASRTVVFLDSAARSAVIPLTWPLTHEARVFRSITVHRPTSAEVGLYFERVRATGGTEPRHLPMYLDEDGVPIPDAVLDGLDDDDDTAVMKAANDFLPLRLRAFLEAMNADSTPDTGARPEPRS